jgi:hypothetical protein
MSSTFPDHPVFVRTCALCNASVELESCKVDELGRAIHEECYISKLRVNAGRVPIPPLRKILASGPGLLLALFSPRRSHKAV